MNARSAAAMADLEDRIARKRAELGRPLKIGYARVSTSDQHPEVQEQRLAEAGVDLIATDRGVSGAKDSRPYWDAVLALVGEGDEITAVKLDRFGRSVANLLNVVEHLRERGAGYRVLDQPDLSMTAGKTSKLLFVILAGVAEFERDLLIERTNDGLATARESRNLRRATMGPPGLGFRLEDGADDWTIDEREAAYLRDAATRFLPPHARLEAVHKQLAADYPDMGHVSVMMLRRALARPASAGLIKVNGDVVPSNVKGPLDVATWRRLALKFEGQRPGSPGDDFEYPFGPLLRCGKCGNQLTGGTLSNGKAYYRCKVPHKSLGVHRPCFGVSVNAGQVEELVRGAVQRWARSKRGRAAALAVPASAGRRAELAAALADAEDMRADIISPYNRRRMSAAKFQRNLAEADAVIAEIETELRELEKLDAEPVDISAQWESLSAAGKRRMVERAVQVPIVVQPGKGGPKAAGAAGQMKLRYPA